MGNNTNLVDPVRSGGPSTQPTQNLTSLAGMFDTSKYIEPTSDIVALMTLEHQVRMTNLMIRIGWDARMGMAEDKLNPEIEEMLKYMLFADEEPLRAPVKGVSTFTETFPQRGPRDPQGRSLRDFDLKTRLFRYPLSYMIYSAAFDGMPDKVRDRVYQRLYEILTGKDTSKTFARLDAGNPRCDPRNRARHEVQRSRSVAALIGPQNFFDSRSCRYSLRPYGRSMPEGIRDGDITDRRRRARPQIRECPP